MAPQSTKTYNSDQEGQYYLNQSNCKFGFIICIKMYQSGTMVGTSLYKWASPLSQGRALLFSPICKLFTWMNFLLLLYPRLGTPVGIILVTANFCWHAIWLYQLHLIYHLSTVIPWYRSPSKIFLQSFRFIWTEWLSHRYPNMATAEFMFSLKLALSYVLYPVLIILPDAWDRNLEVILNSTLSLIRSSHMCH